MDPNGLVFSNRAQYIVARHLIFWLAWWIFFSLTYYFPHFWFLNWRLDHQQLLAVENFGYFRFAQFVVINTFTGGIVTHAFFTYPILYLFLPIFLFRGKYLAFILSVAGWLCLTIWFTYVKFLWFYNPLLQYYNIPAYDGDTSYTIYCIWTQVLFNCPTVAGFAAGLKFFKHYFLKERETQLIVKEKSRAELQVLKSQVHPHFLFNTLNSLYFFTLTSSSRAPELIKKLSELLHYMLYECDQAWVPLEKELKMIQDYMTLEKARYGDHLKMNISIHGKASDKQITPLLLIPFVENSFKHGTSKMLDYPWVNLKVDVDDESLTFILENSKPENFSRSAQNGIGLVNVIRRLQLLHPNSHHLEIREDDESFGIELFVSIKSVNEAEPVEKITSGVSYEWA